MSATPAPLARRMSNDAPPKQQPAPPSSAPPIPPAALADEEPKPHGPPPPLPRSDEAAIEADLAEAMEQVDARILHADAAREGGRWDDCGKWLQDAQAAIWRVRRLGVELSTLRKMRENHD